METGGTSRKFALAGLVVGAALSEGGKLGFGVACGVFVTYSLLNLWEKRNIGPDEVD